MPASLARIRTTPSATGATSTIRLQWAWPEAWTNDLWRKGEAAAYRARRTVLDVRREWSPMRPLAVRHVLGTVVMFLVVSLLPIAAHATLICAATVQPGGDIQAALDHGSRIVDHLRLERD